MSEVQTLQKSPSDIYLEAAVLAQSDKPEELAEAYLLFSQIPDYEDAETRAAALKPYHEQLLKEKEEAEKVAAAKAAVKKRRNRKIIIVTAAVALVLTAFLLTRAKVRSSYANAMELYSQGQYREASKALRFLFFYKDSRATRKKIVAILENYDNIKTELTEFTPNSLERLEQLRTELLSMQDFPEARELLTRFDRRQISYTVSPSSGAATYYSCGYDINNTLTTVYASAHTDSGEFVPTYTQYISGTVEDNHVIYEYDYESQKLSDSTVITEACYYDSGYETEREITYHDDPTLHTFYRWYDAEGKLLYGAAEDTTFPKTTSKKTVEVHCRQLDEDGRLVRSWKLEVSKKGKVSTDKELETTYAYDEKGNLILETHYKTTEKKGKVDFKVSYTYNDQNQLIQMQNDEALTEYTYNSFGELEKTVLKKGKNETTTTYTYGYYFKHAVQE